VAKLDRPLFHNNDVMEQNRIAGCEIMGRNLEYTKGKRSASLVARSFGG
jgi:hypothetical protein